MHSQCLFKDWVCVGVCVCVCVSLFGQNSLPLPISHTQIGVLVRCLGVWFLCIWVSIHTHTYTTTHTLTTTHTHTQTSPLLELIGSFHAKRENGSHSTVSDLAEKKNKVVHTLLNRYSPK